MAVQFQCPHCQVQLRAEDDVAGKAATCPKCGKMITVPQGPSTEEASGGNS